MISMNLKMLIRRRSLRDGLSAREISRQLGVSRITVARLKQDAETEPRYPKRASKPPKKLEPFLEYLENCVRNEVNRGKKNRRSIEGLFEDLKELGYDGCYGSVYKSVRQLRDIRKANTNRAFIPLAFEPGEAYQFDWAEEHLARCPAQRCAIPRHAAPLEGAADATPRS